MSNPRAASGRQRVLPRRRYDPFNPASLWEPVYVDQTDLAARPEYRVLSDPWLVAEIASWHPPNRDALMDLSPAFRNAPRLTAPQVTLLSHATWRDTIELDLFFDEPLAEASLETVFDLPDSIPVQSTRERFLDVYGLSFARRKDAAFVRVITHGVDRVPGLDPVLAVHELTELDLIRYGIVRTSRVAFKRILDDFARQWSAFLITTVRWQEITDDILRYIYTRRVGDAVREWYREGLPRSQ